MVSTQLFCEKDNIYIYIYSFHNIATFYQKELNQSTVYKHMVIILLFTFHIHISE